MPLGLKERIKTVCGQFAAVTGTYARHFSSEMMIVAFHRINDDIPEDDITCGSTKFETFCTFFRKHFRVISLSEQIAGCQAGGDLGGTLSITFDDGYLDNFEIAAPILRKLGLPATFFVITSFIGSQTVAPWDRRLPRQPGWMNWDQLRTLASQGFEIGSHTDGHINLGTADPEIVRTDLAISKRKLADALEISPQLFAYPFGGREDISARSRELVCEAGFACCAGCYGGVNAPTPDPFSLNRIPIAKWFATPDQFGFEVITGRA